MAFQVRSGMVWKVSFKAASSPGGKVDDDKVDDDKVDEGVGDNAEVDDSEGGATRGIPGKGEMNSPLCITFGWGRTGSHQRPSSIRGERVVKRGPSLFFSVDSPCSEGLG